MSQFACVCQPRCALLDAASSLPGKHAAWRALLLFSSHVFTLFLMGSGVVVLWCCRGIRWRLCASCKVLGG